jgi:tRNA/tmRNA/rRNA uracil-C5-methylase (TrmA/RlmC/RlmD family)
VGLFTSALLDEVGAGGRIDIFESSPWAVADARVNFQSSVNVYIHEGDVLSNINQLKHCDVIILDPPRDGAGQKVIEKIARLGARNIVYVACDPAALARDTAYLQASGFTLKEMRAFDLFPMTHHIECVARFTQ